MQLRVRVELLYPPSRGSLEVGKLADLVVLERSPLQDPEHLDAIAVEETIVGGERRWKRGE